MTQIQLLQINQPLEVLHLRDTIRLDGEDLEVCEGVEALQAVESRKHMTDYADVVRWTEAYL